MFREAGVAATSIAEVMAAAGLTHGGFYGHFESKDTLAELACDKAFAQSLARWRQRIDDHPEPGAAWAALVEAYLSRQSRDAVGSGCPTVALAVDVARERGLSEIDGLVLRSNAGMLKLMRTMGFEVKRFPEDPDFALVTHAL